MQPRYMGRIMNTYPVSEPKMDHVSSLNAQTTIRYSVASLLFALGSGIWINATFYTELPPIARLATLYFAPLLLLASIGFVVGAIWSQYQRKGAWEKIKVDSYPIAAVAPATQVVVPISADSLKTSSAGIGSAPLSG
jgi:hypothetical protein